MGVTVTLPCTVTLSIEEMTGKAIRDALLSLSDEERTFITTDPSSGDFRVTAIQRKADGKIEIKYSDVPEV